MATDKERIDYLRKELHRHNYNYYVRNEPEISDKEFDMLLKELEALELQHPEYADPNSPTQRVGSDLSSGFEQVRHIYPMLSLANTYSIDDVDAWVRRVDDALAGEQSTLVGEMKFDGTGISLIYEHGRLVRAVTRGDGQVGDIVTDNVRTIRSIPLELQGEGWPDFFEIRGEIVLPWKAFERLNEERIAAGETPFANPRNAAAGTLKLLNSAETARRGLDAYFYYLLGENLPADTHYDNMLLAKSWGFKVSDAMTLLHSIDEVDKYITYWDTERKNLPVATDGLVFKVNSLRSQLNLGFTAKSPRWAVAYKFAAERALTRLRFVSFDVGRSGIITPVANLEPVLLSGTIVKRASLHNDDIMKALDIHEHDMLYVEKGGEIIPKITGVEIAERVQGSSAVEFPAVCPSCGTRLIRNEGEAAWMCPNKYGCVPQIVGRLEHFVARRAMNIDGIGEETAAALHAHGYVNNIADLYTLQAEQVEKIEGFARKSAQRLIEGIHDSINVPFERVLFSLSIPYLGETTAKKVAKATGSMDKLMSMSAPELEAIPDVGPSTAKSICDFFADPDNCMIVERLRLAGLQMESAADEQPQSDTLAGKTFVISGVFSRHSRDEYKKMIESHGGKNSGSISSKTNYVLAGENMGPAKLEKAAKLGIPIIDEDTFLKMIE